ncbi:hypothetical protein AWC38_SpisGene6530 [Stylophora pistillata]|uniref:Uncharacterized protein n=1 Tax=Stylophora pistillata TaxID=50429 RepID=A0A2B4SH84_STYPI|nr:hypothetical protein AWC38_SpisGene6530 [Stylophora pistillata]
MYALEDLSNTRGEDSVTSGPCVWVRMARANTQACEVKDLVNKKGKIPSHKKRKRNQVYCHNMETDVRAPEERNPPDEEYLRKFTKRLCNLKSRPAILSLFKKLHGTPEEDTVPEEPGQSNHHRPKTGIMNAKLLEILSNDPKTSAEEIVQLLALSESQRKMVRQTSAEKIFKADLLNSRYVFLPINSFLDHLCAAHSITSMTSQRSNYVLKVPQQLPGSNNCGFYIFMFADHFLKDLTEMYESDPNSYVNAEHGWFNPKDAEAKGH